MNLCPIFGLYPDPEDSVMQQLDRATSRALPLLYYNDVALLGYGPSDPRIPDRVQEAVLLREGGGGRSLGSTQGAAQVLEGLRPGAHFGDLPAAAGAGRQAGL